MHAVDIGSYFSSVLSPLGIAVFCFPDACVVFDSVRDSLNLDRIWGASSLASFIQVALFPLVLLASKDSCLSVEV